jgi:hypothetical protein
VSLRGRFGLFLRRFLVRERHPGGKPCFHALTFRSKSPEKQGVFSVPKKHEKNIKKPLASKTLF